MKDIAIVLLALARLGVIPWLLDKMGYEMPKSVATFCFIACVVATCWAVHYLGWAERIPLLGSKKISLSASLLWMIGAVLVLFVLSNHSEYEALAIAKMQMVYGKTFSNQSIDLDGKIFDRCTVNSVTFVFHGKKEFGLVNSTLNERIIFHTDSPEAEKYASVIVMTLRGSRLADASQFGFTNGDDVGMFISNPQPEPMRQ